MQLLLLTPDQNHPHETAIVNQLFGEGLQKLHIRKPHFKLADYRNYVNDIPIAYHPRIVLHGGFELFREFNLSGIHLSSHLREKSAFQNIDLPEEVTSTSFHAWAETMNNKTRYAYVFISPVFDSISKPGYMAGIDLDGLRPLKQTCIVNNQYCPPIVGLGGIGPRQIAILNRYGFDGAAVLGAVWNSKSPVESFLELLVATSLAGDAPPYPGSRHP